MDKTIEKIKESSKIIFIPAIILYFFGFVCINSYLGVFGIVNFDIVNARFLIAGIFPLFSLIAVFYTFWKFHTNIPPKDFFSTRNISKKIYAHIDFILSLFTITYVTYILMRSGANFSVNSWSGSITFKPLLGSFDFIGKYILDLKLNLGYSMNFIFKSTLYSFSYILLVLMFVFLIFIINKWIPKKENKKLSEALEDKLDTPYDNENIKNKVASNNWYSLLATWSFNWLMFCFYISMVIFSYFKLRTEIFDFTSLENGHRLTHSLVFAWIFSTFFIIYLFSISIDNFSIKTLNFNFMKKMSHLNNLPLLFQQLIIPVFASLFLFGVTVFPYIPFVIGGGEPRLVKINMVDSTKNMSGYKTYLIGENAQFLFIVSIKDAKGENKALQINKNLIASIETRNSKE